jgi:hypothetical protein
MPPLRPPVPAHTDPPPARVRDAQFRVYDAAPDTNDASDMYVIDVFGMSILVRLRATTNDPADGDQPPQLYVHIDNESRPPTELVVEVCGNGETDCRI